MTRPTPNVPLLATALLGAALLQGCRSDDPLGPIPRLNASHAVVGGSTVDPPLHNEVGSDPVSTGIYIPEGVEVVVTASGFLHYSLNQARLACGPGPVSEPPGGFTEVGPAGFPEELYPNWLYTGHNVVAWIPETNASVDFRPRDPSAESVSGRLTGPGTLWVRRFPGFPGSCWSEATGYQPDYFVSGMQTLTVEVLDPSISIEVVCTGSGAPRGNVVSCAARPQPAGQTLVVTGWTFTSAAGDVVTRPTNVSDQTWVGQLVVDGSIAVTGTVAGHPASGSATVAVTGRDWTQKIVNHRVEEDTVRKLPTHPTKPGDLGDHAPFAQAYLPPNGYVQVPSGPNQGMFYFAEVPVEALSRIRINRVALSTGSDFYNLQPKNAGPGKCTRSDVVPFLPLAEDHEGLTLSSTSHAGVFRNELNRQVPQATEHVVSLNDLARLLDRADTAAAPGIAAAQNAAKDQRDGGTVPPIPYCTFKFF